MSSESQGKYVRLTWVYFHPDAYLVKQPHELETELDHWLYALKHMTELTAARNI